MEIAEYYKKFFPLELICKWLDYKSDGKASLKYREFAFILPGDIYLRYQAFEDSMEFRQALLHRIPSKIDVGAVFNMSPKIARSFPNEFKPQEHELVFDIDISDYDDVRNCCKESNICDRCWPFMKVGAKILHKILTQEFGFRHLLFVFSGRRGFHCWVCDKEARVLKSDARKAITDYFSVVTGGQAMVKRVSLNPSQGIHPMLCKALEVIDQHFEDLMVKNQDFLASENLVQDVIDLCEDSLLKQKITEKCKYTKLSSADCWKTIQTLSDNHRGAKRGRANYFLEEVKLQHCFPRLDANVTKGFNHLLKLPFCVHPKTGNICVPIDIERIDEFSIFTVPNLKTLSRETMDKPFKILKRFVDSLQ